MNIVINGAGVAGPALAFWLEKAGHRITLVEEAPQLRTGGYIIDFWGIGYDIAERMGIVSHLRELGYQVKEVRFVDDEGRTKSSFGTQVFVRATDGRFTSLKRSDLAAAIFSTLGDRVETIFDDSISGIVQRENSVTVSFVNSSEREFDLVIGADGLHSKVRELVFGGEHEFEHPLGYHVAAFQADGYGPRDDLVYLSYALPGRQVSRFSMRDDKTLFLFIFRDEYLDGARPSGSEGKAAVREVFSTAKWECPSIFELMRDAPDFYFDTVSQIRMDHWTNGRAALIGDAAACVSLLAGEGTGLAMAEAYVLGGELKRSPYHEAFAKYERRMMPFIKSKQNSAAKFASSFVPAASIGLIFRNVVTKLLRFDWIANYFVVSVLRDDLELPDYFQ